MSNKPMGQRTPSSWILQILIIFSILSTIMTVSLWVQKDSALDMETNISNYIFMIVSCVVSGILLLYYSTI